ncbi:DNA primase [Acidithiobacillus sp. HP-11]|uniref:DNA primase n=1 Tax=Acidithiobacillus sp. HP-11 TaxID=2697656 RepID=UPI00187ADB31|nr:DNA primase [Acidithiobacillus sp. HP-11]MBE7567259.1 DNA primase [Acidithiobacillus sp. HP-11]
MTLPIDKILQSLESVKRTGTGKWQTRCPAHDDRRPSLSVRETEDGTVLLHCFAGCGAQEITSALGLGLADLFPGDRYSVTNAKPMRRTVDYKSALLGIHTEAVVVASAAVALANGEELDDSGVERLLTAEQRISDAISVAGGAL